jgi:transcriptional regulator with XRE-family HTH domain
VTLSTNIHAAQLRSGMNQRAFADAIGVSESALSEWISGAKEPTLERAYALALALGTTIDELAGSELPDGGQPSPMAIPDFGEGVRAAIASRAGTISGLARASGVAKSTIHAWLRGGSPRLPQAFEAAAALGVSVHELCGGRGAP